MVYVTTCTRSDHTRSVSVHVSCVDQQCVDQASGVADACRDHTEGFAFRTGSISRACPSCRRVVVGEGQSGRRSSLEHDTPQLFRARPPMDLLRMTTTHACRRNSSDTNLLSRWACRKQRSLLPAILRGFAAGASCYGL